MTTAPAPRRRSYNAGTRDTPCRSAGTREQGASTADAARTLRSRFRACRRSCNAGTRDALCMEIASLA